MIKIRLYAFLFVLAGFVACREKIKLLPPQADFIVDNRQVAAGDTVRFGDKSTGIPESFSWYFEGANPQNVQNQREVKIIYPEPGLYDVQLIVGEDGLYDTLLRQDYISVTSALIARFQASQQEILKEQSISFIDISEGDPGPDSRLWLFEGGSPANSTDSEPEVSYPDTGSYDITLIVSRGPFSDTLVAENYITVYQPIEAKIESLTDTIIPIGGSIQFQDSSEPSSERRNWTFEGGVPSTSIENSPQITYSEAGTFDVSLNAAANISEDETTRPDWVHVIDSVQAAIMISDGPDFVVNFSNISQGDVEEVLWELYEIGPNGASFLLDQANSFTWEKSLYQGTFRIDLKAKNRFFTDSTSETFSLK